MALIMRLNFDAGTLLKCQGNHIKIVKCIDWEDVDEPCKGDTPA